MLIQRGLRPVCVNRYWPCQYAQVLIWSNDHICAYLCISVHICVYQYFSLSVQMCPYLCISVDLCKKGYCCSAAVLHANHSAHHTFHRRPEAGRRVSLALSLAQAVLATQYWGWLSSKGLSTAVAATAEASNQLRKFKLLWNFKFEFSLKTRQAITAISKFKILAQW